MRAASGFAERGTRISAERLTRAQETYTGASYPGTNRLYEFTSGATTAVIARACWIWPAMNCLANVDRP